MSYSEISVTTPKARKPYRCEWCPEKIEAGEKHVYRVYVFEGDFQNGRMHTECFEAMQKSRRDEVADGWLPCEFKRGVPA